MRYGLDMHLLLFTTVYPASFFKTPYVTITKPLETPRIEKFF
jgi:hypothetical protein